MIALQKCNGCKKAHGYFSQELGYVCGYCGFNNEMNTEMCGKCGDEKDAIGGKIEHPHKDYPVFICSDCDSVAAVTFSPYGASQMAAIDCPNCGVSYDTDLDPTDYEIN